jgi:hypothetical protein
MADRDDDRYDDDRRDDDDRPRRRREYDDDRPPRRKGGKGLMITMIIIGSLIVLCGGGCVGGGYMYYKWIADMMAIPEAFLAKVKAGDYQGAYNSTSAAYKAKYTLQQFTDAMKGAKLDQNSGLAAPLASQSGRGAGPGLIATVGVPGGKTTDVTFQLVQEGAFNFVVGDITGPDISYTGPPKPREMK